MRSPKLTRRQKAYMDWITWFHQRLRRAPVYREIAAGMKRSTTAVFNAVLMLTEKGYLEQEPGHYGTTRPRRVA